MHQVGLRHLMEFFALHQLPAELAVTTYKLYGEGAIDMLYDDPYLLTDEGMDAPFGAVDRFAIELGVAGDDPRRVEAGVLFELRYHLTAGHSFLPENKLIDATAQLLSVPPDTVSKCVQKLVFLNRLASDRLADIDIIYLPDLYIAEAMCTHQLLDFAEAAYPAPKNLKKLLEKVSMKKVKEIIREKK